MNIAQIILNSDLKHCKLDQAKEICKELAEETYNFIHEDEIKSIEIYEIRLDSKPNELEDYEYLWYNHWDEFVDYIREKYKE